MGFCCLELEEEGGVPEVCKILANLFCLLQKFFTSVPVLPDKYIAILAHLGIRYQILLRIL